ncbi:ERC protein 2 isoform X9 [Thalassophryne amazonica]|uniref:ERC protein 2 isoform X9 n=1 Tax=Thalassophryne amazonica TaxID=390379 RepID=UPI0014711B48|nr:ERC protein 2 isoform X9 [Thalassophryne amazonica]
MPLNIRAKPPQSKLSAASKSSGHTSLGSTTSHSCFSKSPKLGKGRQTGSSTPGCRSGLEPGCVLGGVPPTELKLAGDHGSGSRPGSKSKTGTAPDKGAVHRSTTAPGGKTLSMENIQSLSAVYATSGTMYPNERDALESSGGYPKGTMTLDRSASRSSYTGRSTAMGSSPNITSSGLSHTTEPYGHQTSHSAGTSSLHRQSRRCRQGLDSAGWEEVSTLDLQTQLRDLQRENDHLRNELNEGRDGRSGPSINNVNIWSPDAKREKGTGQEERVRGSVLKDQSRMNQVDLQQPEDFGRNKQLPLTVQELQEELRSHREMNSGLQLQQQQQQQQGNTSSYRDLHVDQDHRGVLSPGHSPRQSPSHLHSSLQKKNPRPSPSNTYNPRQQDADIIIHSPNYGCNTSVTTQRLSPANTLQPGTRNSPGQTLYSPHQGPHSSLVAPCQVPGCDGCSSASPLDGSDENFFRLQSEHERQAKELFLLRKTMEEMEKRIDSQKQTLGARDESIQRLLEMLQGQGHGQGHWGQGQRSSVVTMAAQEPEALLENVQAREIEQLKQELSRKESEMQALQTKLETLTNQNSDCKQHIEVLKESLSAKEQRGNTLQTEVDALRVRLEEKEQFLTKKTKQLQDLTDEKSTLTGEIRDMKDMLDVKERKVNVLQKKIENLLEQLKDKDKQLASLRERVQGLQTDSSNTDTALATLEEALSEKERIIENLREQREREDRGRLEELEQMRKENQNLKDRLAALQPQKLSLTQAINPGQTQNQKADEEKQNLEDAVWKCPDITDRLRLLEQELARYRDESGKSQAEVERLMAALREAEMDRSCKEKKISDLERPGQLKSPNIQKQMLPAEMRKDALTEEHPHSLSQLEELMGALEKTRRELDATKLCLSSTQQSLYERDGHLSSLRVERRKQLDEILEMKQQALLAAISEKDANIALLELSSSKRKKVQEEVMALKREKDRLMHQLKQQTQSRMTLMTDNYEEEHMHPQHHPHHDHHMHLANVHHRSLPRGPPHMNQRPQMEQDDEEGIWA